MSVGNSRLFKGFSYGIGKFSPECRHRDDRGSEGDPGKCGQRVMAHAAMPFSRVGERHTQARDWSALESADRIDRGTLSYPAMPERRRGAGDTGPEGDHRDIRIENVTRREKTGVHVDCFESAAEGLTAGHGRIDKARFDRSPDDI